MRQFVAFLLFVLTLAACDASGGNPQQGDNVTMEIRSAELLDLSGNSTRRIRIVVRIHNDTAGDIFLEPDAFWYIPDSDTVSNVNGRNLWGGSSSECPSAPVRPSSARNCRLILGWEDTHPIDEVVPGRVIFNERGTDVGAGARVEGLDG